MVGSSLAGALGAQGLTANPPVVGRAPDLEQYSHEVHKAAAGCDLEQRALELERVLQGDTGLEEHPLESALRDSEARFRRLVENSPIGVYIGSNGRIAYCNPEFARLVGAASPDAALGTSVLDFIHPSQWEAAYERIEAYDSGRERRKRRLEERLVRRDGTEILVDLVVTPFFHEGRHAVQVVMRDITAQKQAEERLRASELRYRELAAVLEQTNRELQRTSDMRDALGRMVVHDIRNPLSVLMLILGNSSAESGLQLGEAEAALARQQLAYSVELCNQLLDIQRMQDSSMPLALQESCLAVTLRDTVAPLQLIAHQRGVQIEANCPALPWRSDHQLVRRILANLLGNAVKHAPPGSEVIVECQVQADAAVVTVTDGGPGIAYADQERIFDLFTTAGDKATRGHGIGLAFCKLAAAALNAELLLVSEPGEGSSFSLILPQLER